MKVKDLAPDTTVKIGTTFGSNFVYAGVVGDMDIDDEKCLDDTWLAFAIAVKEIKDIRNKKYSKKKLETFLEKYHLLTDWKPIAEREIVEIEESLAEEGVYRVIVNGMESGKRWMVNDDDKPCKIESDRGAELLVGAVYRDLVEDLIASYVKALITGNEEASMHAMAQERFIMLNQYNASVDPEGIIRMARKVAEEHIAEKRGIDFARRMRWNFLTKQM